MKRANVATGEPRLKFAEEDFTRDLFGQRRDIRPPSCFNFSFLGSAEFGFDGSLYLTEFVGRAASGTCANVMIEKVGKEGFAVSLFLCYSALVSDFKEESRDCLFSCVPGGRPVPVIIVGVVRVAPESAYAGAYVRVKVEGGIDLSFTSCGRSIRSRFQRGSDGIVI